MNPTASAPVRSDIDQVIAGTASAGGMPVRVLGRTGVKVSIVCLGGWHIGDVKDKDEAVRIMHAAVDAGINFFDNAWDYHWGGSEEIMGRALAGAKRDKVFLMTKNCERDYAGSLRNLEDSLRRLRTDRVDLWQFHEICYDNDPDWVFDKGGLKAALEARKAGKVRFIGFTGHKDPLIHLKMIGKPFDWDTSQMPINVCDRHYRSFIRQVVPECNRRNIGVIGMKALGGGTRGAAKIPVDTGLSAAECYRYALSQDISSLCVGIDGMDMLEQALRVARNFKPMSPAEQEAFAARVADSGGDGRHELFKSSKKFDGPHHRKQHGFAEELPG
jgi:predicted aldo/keto reductase-like oxidoreductase